MMDDLEKIAQDDHPKEDTETSDFAPISPFADMPTKEEELKKSEQEIKTEFINSVKVVSSASETEESGTEAISKKQQKL